MTEPATAPPASSGDGPAGGQHRSGSARPEERGALSIADAVVAKLAGAAVRQVPGIHDLGAGGARTLGAVREHLPGARAVTEQGITVEVGERQAAVDVTVVLEYGTPAREVAGAVRAGVSSALADSTGLEVVEVTVTVDDVHLPDEDDGADEAPARVQ